MWKYLNEEQLSNFFQVPKKINNKYKKCKYFIIINEQNGNNYLETIRYLCDLFGIKLVLIIYVQNKNYKINKKILQNPFVHIILTFSENNILYTRIKELNINYIDENKAFEKKLPIFNYDFPKFFY